MRWLSRLIIGATILLTGARAAGFLWRVTLSLTWPLESFHLEAKFVSLALRVMDDASLYPDFQAYPYVANFFGPIYFLLVGGIGKALGADIPGLFWLGRLVTLIACLVVAALAGAISGRRGGVAAGIAGSLLCLGAAPVFLFGIMARPDMTAEALGLLGFFAVQAASLPLTLVGCVLLSAAFLTKQTAASLLTAAVLALWFGGRRGRSLLVFSVTSLGTLLILLAYRRFEPNLLRCLAGEAMAPWDSAHGLETLWRAWSLAPELFVLPALGMWCWWNERRIDLVALAGTVMLTSVVTVFKLGSDLNYFLTLRFVAALSLGPLVAMLAPQVSRSALKNLAVLIAGVLAIVSLVPGLLFATVELDQARQSDVFLTTSDGQAVLAEYLELTKFASDNPDRLFTNVGLIALYQRQQAPFVDPWLFRLLVDESVIVPTTLLTRIDRADFELVVLSAPVEGQDHVGFEFGLPEALRAAVRRRYHLAAQVERLYLYQRR